MELFSRRSNWIGPIVKQLLNYAMHKFLGFIINTTASFAFYMIGSVSSGIHIRAKKNKKHKHNSSLLGPIQPSSPQAKELHG